MKRPYLSREFLWGLFIIIFIGGTAVTVYFGLAFRGYFTPSAEAPAQELDILVNQDGCTIRIENQTVQSSRCSIRFQAINITLLFGNRTRP